jgi:hypothetical protein
MMRARPSRHATRADRGPAAGDFAALPARVDAF